MVPMTDLGRITRDYNGRSGPGRAGPLDPVIAELSGRQHGRVARRQLLQIGVGEDAIDYRLKTRRLHVIYPGVYAVGHRGAGRMGAWMAAVLYAGPNAVLSHLDAGALWGICANSSARSHVTTTDRGRGSRRGVIVHRVRGIIADEIAIRNGIPVTSLARALLDIAEVLDAVRLARAIEESERLGLLDLRELERTLARARGRRGAKPLKAGLAEQRLPDAFTRSGGERLLRRICADAGLPQPSMNLWIERFEVDAFFREAGLIVEVDTFDYHRSRAAFERDRAKDATLQVAGYRVVRLTKARLEREPAAVAGELRALLGATAQRPGVRA